MQVEDDTPQFGDGEIQVGEGRSNMPYGVRIMNSDQRTMQMKPDAEQPVVEPVGQVFGNAPRVGAQLLGYVGDRRLGGRGVPV
ncbi:hypothetical protein GCM10009735_82830 [Actinomadura chokoriensis]